MTKLKYFWVLMVGLAVACADTDPQVFQLNEPVNIHESELVTFQIPQQGTSIDLSVLEITESRCPSDVTCIRFGEARVSVAVNGTDKVIKRLDMCIGDCPERVSYLEVDTIDVELNDRSYQVILSGVTPYPSLNNSIIPKQALIKIIEL